MHFSSLPESFPLKSALHMTKRCKCLCSVAVKKGQNQLYTKIITLLTVDPDYTVFGDAVNKKALVLCSGLCDLIYCI